MYNLIISFSLMEAARVFSVGLCTVDVSSIAQRSLENYLWNLSQSPHFVDLSLKMAYLTFLSFDIFYISTVIFYFHLTLSRNLG